jgi:hypothetical protein
MWILRTCYYCTINNHDKDSREDLVASAHPAFAMHYCFFRLCSFRPTPVGIGAKSLCVSRDQIRGGLIPPFSFNAFG